METLGPRNELERFLAVRIVKQSWRMDRGVTAEKGRVVNSRRRRVSAANRDAEELLRLSRKLPTTRPEVVRTLGKTPAGCRWMLAQWRVFAKRLEDHSYLLPTQSVRLIHLLGKQTCEIFSDDEVVFNWLTAHFGTLGDELRRSMPLPSPMPSAASPATMLTSEFEHRIEQFVAAIPEKTIARRADAEYVAKVIADFEAAAREREIDAKCVKVLAVQAARVDLSTEGMKLLSYEMSHERSFHAALRKLEALQNPKRPGRGPAKTEPVTADGDTDDTTLPAQDGVTTEDPPAVTIDRLSTDPVAPEARPPTGRRARKQPNRRGSRRPNSRFTKIRPNRRRRDDRTPGSRKYDRTGDGRDDRTPGSRKYDRTGEPRTTDSPEIAKTTEPEIVETTELPGSRKYDRTGDRRDDRTPGSRKYDRTGDRRDDRTPGSRKYDRTEERDDRTPFTKIRPNRRTALPPSRKRPNRRRSRRHHSHEPWKRSRRSMGNTWEGWRHLAAKVRFRLLHRARLRPGRGLHRGVTMRR